MAGHNFFRFELKRSSKHLPIVELLVGSGAVAAEGDGGGARGEGVPDADVAPPLDPLPPHPRLPLPLCRPVPHLRHQDWVEPQ